MKELHPPEKQIGIHVIPSCKIDIPYFFGYKMEIFSLQNTKKNLDLSCKMELDLWDCLGRLKLIL